MDEPESKLKVIVGLGNPGRKYEGTRHNVGFDVLDRLSQRLGASEPQSKFDGRVTSVNRDDARLLLVWPMTYMNRSGQCASAVARFYKVEVEKNLIVVCDDLSLPLGKIRIRAKGSAGGQKGLNDILRAFGHDSIPRLRIGIDAAPQQRDAADYVLSRFNKSEMQTIEDAVDRACDALLDWFEFDLAFCMNRFN